MKRRLLTTAIAVLAVVALTTTIASAVAVAARPGSDQDEIVVVSGVVESVWSDGFALADGARSFRIDCGPAWSAKSPIYVGETAEVTGGIGDKGRLSGPTVIDAFTVRVGGSATLEVRAGPGRPPWAARPPFRDDVVPPRGTIR